MIRWLYKFSNKDYGSGKGLDYPKPKENGLLWLYVTAPTDEEFRRLRKEFGITHSLHYCKERRSVKYSYYPALSFCLVDYFFTKDGAIKRTNILYWVKHGLVISIMPERIPPYEKSFEDICSELRDYPTRASYLLYDVMDEDAEENFDVLEIIDRRIASFEKKILDPAVAPDVIGDVIRLKRELTDMTRVFWCSAKILYSIRKGMTPLKLDEDTSRLLDDIHDTYIHQVDVVTTQKEVLTDILTIHQATISNKLAGISNRINNSLKRLTWIMLLLTGVTLVLTIPNTLATIFGIPYFPIEDWHWPSIAAIILISTMISLLWFWHYWNYVKRLHEKNENGDLPR